MIPRPKEPLNAENRTDVKDSIITCSSKNSKKEANDNDFHFLKLLGNGFEIPEQNSFNTNLAREAVVRLHPLTDVTYMPLINISPADTLQ